MVSEINLIKPTEVEFTEINLAGKKTKKCPKRLVYFSDGILEEYSSDEDELDKESDTQPLIDPKTLPWIPYFGYLMWWLGSRTLAVCDYLGEHLAWFLGITSPKFQYELEQYQQLMKEQQELENYIVAENAGWTKTIPDNNLPQTIESQPKTIVASNSDNSQKVTVSVNDSSMQL